jgi:hypothetical protein
MTININSAAFKAALDTMNANQMADMLRAMTFGHFVRQQRAQLYAAVPLLAGVNPYVPAASQTLTLPDDAKATTMARVYARVGTAACGPVIVDNPDSFVATTPAAGHCTIAATGDLIFNAADAWTSIDVLYHPAIYDVIEVTMPVVGNAIAWPPSGVAAAQEALFLMEAEGVLPANGHKLIIDAPAAAQVTANHACLNLAKSSVLLTAGDAWTSVRLKMAVAPFLDINALLETTSNFF